MGHPRERKTAHGSVVPEHAMKKKCPVRRYIAFTAVVLWVNLCSLSCLAAGSYFPIADFMVTYRVTEALFAADLELSLVSSESGQVMTRRLVPAGLFSLFLPAETKAGSMRWLDDRVVPLNYWVKVGKDIREELHFDWEKRMVSVDYRENQREIPVSVGTLDEMAMQTQILVDMKSGEWGPWDYRVVSRGELKNYRYEVVGEETIETIFGELPTLVLVRHKGGKIDYRFWSSPAYDYLPVKGEKIVNDEVKYEMRLKKWSGVHARQESLNH